MDTKEEMQEKKAKRTGLIITISLHGILALLFLFLVAWREPNPPLPEYGFELLGLDAQGGGDTEQTEPIEEESESSDEASEEPVEETVEEEVSEPEEVTETPTEPVEEPVEETEVTETESPDVREEVVKPKPEEKPVTKKEPEKPVEKTEPTENTGTKTGVSTPAEETPKVNTRGLYKGPSKGPGTSTSGEFEGGSYEGFEGFSVPNFEYVDDKQEFGTMKFEIKVDEYGYVQYVKVLQSDFRPEIRLKYESFLRNLRFTAKNNNVPGATGTVTYVIKAK